MSRQGCVVLQQRAVGFGGGDRLILTEKMEKEGVITKERGGSGFEVRRPAP